MGTDIIIIGIGDVWFQQKRGHATIKHKGVSGITKEIGSTV